MPHAYKKIFEQVNESRKKRGFKTITWQEFISNKNDRVVKTYHQKLVDHVEPDPPKKIVRPSANYDNISGREATFKKYQVDPDD